MKVLIVSGIWPPDVGGPATHAPEVAEFLRARGHEVEVLTTAAAAPAPRPYPVHWVPRQLPAAGRYARGAVLVSTLAFAAAWAVAILRLRTLVATGDAAPLAS